MKKIRGGSFADVKTRLDNHLSFDYFTQLENHPGFGDVLSLIPNFRFQMNKTTIR
jgi:hypothetical protein